MAKAQLPKAPPLCTSVKTVCPGPQCLEHGPAPGSFSVLTMGTNAQDSLPSSASVVCAVQLDSPGLKPQLPHSQTGRPRQTLNSSLSLLPSLSMGMVTPPPHGAVLGMQETEHPAQSLAHSTQDGSAEGGPAISPPSGRFLRVSCLPAGPEMCQSSCFLTAALGPGFSHSPLVPSRHVAPSALKIHVARVPGLAPVPRTWSCLAVQTDRVRQRWLFQISHVTVTLLQCQAAPSNRCRHAQPLSLHPTGPELEQQKGHCSNVGRASSP